MDTPAVTDYAKALSWGYKFKFNNDGTVTVFSPKGEDLGLFSINVRKPYEPSTITLDGNTTELPTNWITNLPVQRGASLSRYQINNLPV